MGRIQENLTGRTFGQLTVLGEGPRDEHGRLLWRCRCACGKEKEAQTGHLKSGSIASCGCLRGKKRIEDLSDRVFGQLVVVGPYQRQKGAVYWPCRCACGTEKLIAAADLVQGPHSTVSCGCQRGHTRGAQLTTHGESYGANKKPEFGVWLQMHGRCEQPSTPSYKNYGGRGISVCARWSGPTGYQNFLEDMGRRPSPKHQIDRINNDGNYEKNNCAWVTRLVQMSHTRHNHPIEYKGETLHLAEWARRIGVNAATLRRRLKHGWPIERALTTPARDY